MPLFLGVSVAAALLAVGDLPAAVGAISRARPLYLLFGLAALFAYEAVQCAQWHVLVRRLGSTAPLRAQAFAFLVGSAAKALPVGNFVPTLLLQRAGGPAFRRSSVATLLSVLIEVAIALLGLVVLGLGPWTWLRPLIVFGLATVATVLWVLSRLRYLPCGMALSGRLTQRRIVHAAVSEVRQIRADVRALARWCVLALVAPLGALYLLLGGSALYLVARSLGLDGLPWPDVLAVYFFSLAAGLILPVPVDIGVTEVGAIASSRRPRAFGRA